MFTYFLYVCRVWAFVCSMNANMFVVMKNEMMVKAIGWKAIHFFFVLVGLIVVALKILCMCVDMHFWRKNQFEQIHWKTVFSTCNGVVQTAANTQRFVFTVLHAHVILKSISLFLFILNIEINYIRSVYIKQDWKEREYVCIFVEMTSNACTQLQRASLAL